MHRVFLPATLLLTSLACGGSSEPATAPEAPAKTADPATPSHDGAHGEGADDAAFRPIDIEGAAVHFVAPEDGAEVTSPVPIEFGVKNLEVIPAGPLKTNTGHHHLIINGQPVAAGEAVPADDTHIHFGKGQTETTAELPPGEHVLTMQFADGLHRSYGPDMSATIRVTVVEGAAGE